MVKWKRSTWLIFGYWAGLLQALSASWGQWAASLIVTAAVVIALAVLEFGERKGD